MTAMIAIGIYLEYDVLASATEKKWEVHSARPLIFRRSDDIF
jgi:hypothetical protein